MHVIATLYSNINGLRNKASNPPRVSRNLYRYNFYCVNGPVYRFGVFSGQRNK